MSIYDRERIYQTALKQLIDDAKKGK